MERAEQHQCWASWLQAGSPNYVAPCKQNVNTFCPQKSQPCLTVVALSKNSSNVQNMRWMHESQLTVLTLYFIVTVNTCNQNTAETHQTDDETAGELLLFTIWSYSTHNTLNITTKFYWRRYRLSPEFRLCTCSYTVCDLALFFTFKTFKTSCSMQHLSFPTCTQGRETRIFPTPAALLRIMVRHWSQHVQNHVWLSLQDLARWQFISSKPLKAS